MFDRFKIVWTNFLPVGQNVGLNTIVEFLT